MEQRLTLITLGVDDLARSTAFFEKLGWRRSFRQAEGVSFFQCGGIALALWPKTDLAADAGVATEAGGFGNIAIAHNGRSRAEVDTIWATRLRLAPRSSSRPSLPTGAATAAISAISTVIYGRSLGIQAFPWIARAR